MFLLTLLSMGLAAVTSAVPIISSCDLSNVKIDIPPSATTFTVPTTPPNFVGLGFGWQNYTCNATSQTYASIGAIAELVDASCTTKFGVTYPQLSKWAYSAWNSAPPQVTPEMIANDLPLPLLGQHYFSGTPAAPHWDFSAPGDIRAGNPDAFVVGKRIANFPSPDGPTNIDFLQLQGVAGKLATSIYRLDTQGGPAPASCSVQGQVIQVKYTAIYWFFGSTLSP